MALAALSVSAPQVRAQNAKGETIVYFIRNGEKASTSEVDPSLSKAGRKRAAALRFAMRDTKLDEILVTQFKRTSEMASPVAGAKKITPTVVSVGSSPADYGKLVAKAVMEHRGGSVLVIGHSNTVSPAIAALGGPKLPDICDSAYSILFTLHVPASGTPSLTRATFGPPDQSDPTTCGKLLSR
jgi:broad specificity phosphatase PhoE